MKKILIFSLCFLMILTGTLSVGAADAVSAVQIENLMPFDLDCRSAVLMDSATGTVLYEKNADEALPPASVTKVMTLLLTMEAIEAGKLKLEDKLSVSEYAASMGGSQVYLEPGEEMTVDELLKCVVVSSANDAAVTLAEAVAGTETTFITMMNERARELGMKNSVFENATGLDDTVTNHVTSARDIAVMSRALMAHPLILQYSSIWMDTVRNGEFGLSNTNRLIRFYSGATGLKTGSTAKAKFCISATACRDGLHLIAVIMGSPTRDIRNECAKTLLDYGFANFSIYTNEGGEGSPVKVTGGVLPECRTEYDGCSVLLPKGAGSEIKADIEAPEAVGAPVKKGDVIGNVRFMSGENVVGEAPLLCSETVEKITFFGLFCKLLGVFTLS
ncbi:MAG: D-alanyl-D-alanine carboxypeptidase [Ruminococcaceae bacterium]|nr:D-alanyl-D-alanine carboxypeptidase [Oscillospiraceae bacterium]